MLQPNWFPNVVVLIGLTAVLALLPEFSEGRVTARDYQIGCATAAQRARWGDIPDEVEDAARGCLGALSVVLHTAKQRGICTEGYVAPWSAAGVVATYLEEHPDAQAMDFRKVAETALREVYPCRRE